MSNVHMLSFHGDLDISHKDYIARQFGRIAFFGPQPATILDLSDATCVDTTFINALVFTETHKRPGARMCIVANNRIARLFEITRLDEVFPIFCNVVLANRFDDVPSSSERSLEAWA